jgi:hypothetical protein
MYNIIARVSCIRCTIMSEMYFKKHFTHCIIVFIFCLMIFLVKPPSSTVHFSPDTCSFSLGRKSARSQKLPSHSRFLNWRGNWRFTYSAVSTDWGSLLFQIDLPSNPQSSSSDSLLFLFRPPCFDSSLAPLSPIPAPPGQPYPFQFPRVRLLIPLTLNHDIWVGPSSYRGTSFRG